jgi:hypothetical protein
MKPVRLIVFVTLLGATCSAAFAAGTDDLWEMNITINSSGHSMPLQTMNNCMTKGQNHPPPPDKNCKVTTHGGLVGKGSSVMECAGPPPSTIKIEGTFTATTMKGTMTFTSEGSSMVQEFTGKIIGNCDAATFKPGSQSGMAMGGAMPGMNMPSFDPRSRPPKRSSSDASEPNAANETDAPAQKAPNEQPKDNSNYSIDSAKKALGGLLHF